MTLLTGTELPDGFSYPAEFLRVVDLGLINLEPWTILLDEELVHRNSGLRERYPERVLVPFARRQDNDDVACWDVSRGHVIIVHDFASPGYEERQQFEGFYSWLRQAVEDLIEFD